MIIDTHAHYDDEKFDEDREELLLSLKDAGIERVINMGTCVKTSREAVKLAKTYAPVYAAVGIHPEEIADPDESRTEEIRALAGEEKVVMIGEIGLDYYWVKDNKEEQKRVFREQLKLAAELDLPVSVHSRDAAEDTLTVITEEVALAKEKGQRLTGIIHCFGYSPEMAESFVKLGFLIGIGGVVTFKNSKKLKETVKEIPLEKLVLETDAPYLAPEPFRGKRNSSIFLPYVAETIAQIKGITREEVEKVTTENAYRLIKGM